MCVAPGGFLSTAIDLNPGVEVTGFSLTTSNGGYHVLLPQDKQECISFLDITMLAADMGVAAIPENHPDAAGFLRRHLSEDQLFDLLIYDGSVLRTHKTSPYRKPRKPARLKFT